MASIRKRANSYEISVCYGTRADGKANRHTMTYTPTSTTPKRIEAEVQAVAAEYERKIKAGKLLDGELLTFNEYIPFWKENYLVNHMDPDEITDYMSIVNQYFVPSLGNLKMSNIHPLHLQEIYKQMAKDNKATSRIKKVHAVASSIFRHAFKDYTISENICLRIELPKGTPAKEMGFFTAEQATTFLSMLDEPYLDNCYVKTQFKVYFYLAVYGGFRRGELIALTWQDVDFERNSINITKSARKSTGKQRIKEPKTHAGYREVNLPSSCISLLRQWKAEQKAQALAFGTAWQGYYGSQFDKNWIFITDDGRQMNLDTPGHKFRKLINYYNQRHPDNPLPVIRLHDLRHTCATLLIANQIDYKTVSARLGHSKTSVTMDIYAHAIKELDVKAADTLETLLTKPESDVS